MYIYDRLSGPENRPITSGPEFQAEMEEYKKLKERLEALYGIMGSERILDIGLERTNSAGVNFMADLSLSFIGV